MAWVDKPVVVTRHAVTRYKNRFMLERGEAMSDDQIRFFLAGIVREENIHRVLSEGITEFKAGGIIVVVVETHLRRIVTCKGERSFQSLRAQMRAIQRALNKRRERWLG